jgi:hypothetical protein
MAGQEMFAQKKIIFKISTVSESHQETNEEFHDKHEEVSRDRLDAGNHACTSGICKMMKQAKMH